MARNASEMERAVARTLRDSLETLQRNREDVDQAVADLVSACSSARASNTLPPLLRAQTAAAGLGATLNVLSRFLTMAMQPGWSSPLAEGETEVECETSAARAVSQPQVAATPVAAAVPTPAPVRTPVAPPIVEAVQAQAPALAPAPVLVPVPVIEFPSVSSAVEVEPEPAAVEEALRSVAVESVPELAPAPPDTIAATAAAAASAPVSEAALAPELPAFEIPQAEVGPPDPADLRTALELLEPIEEPVEPVAAQNDPPVAVAAAAQQEAVAAASPVIERPVFDVAALPTDQQELHRRANRVAKVSMQDIKMLRPADVVAGKENHDICLRLRDDIERAHKEYERRFHAILDHPVDYFYAWMVEILGEGDPRVLGNYPYSSQVARR
jgi:hypothetical protein